MINLEARSVVLSGGEPTIHPRFLDIMDHILSRGCSAYILSNGEKFGDAEFRGKFLDLAAGADVTVTTTFHSHIPSEHEKQNGSPGSYGRSLSGLKGLDEADLRISVKHCLTALNHTGLKDFLGMVVDEFSPRAEIQLWGLDYAGMDADACSRYHVSYPELRRSVEDALDWFESAGLRNVINLNNLPLCLTDPYYWRYFSDPVQEDYLEPDGSSNPPNHGPMSRNCSLCPVARECMGAYVTAFERFGDDIVHPPEILSVADAPPLYQAYDEDNIGKLYFSPYTLLSFSRAGLVMVNRRCGVPVVLRCRADEIREFTEALHEGIGEDAAEELCRRIGRDGLFEDLIYFGVIE